MTKLRLLEGRLTWHRGKYEFRKRKFEGYELSRQRAAYWLKVNEAKHDAAAVKGDKASLARAQVGVAKWAKLMGVEATEVNALVRAIAALKPKPPAVASGEGVSRPVARWNPSGKPIANWIVRELEWAAAHGWQGVVVSGYRTNPEQLAAATNYCRELGVSLSQEYPDGVYASNHCGYVLPKGAVDVTDASVLNSVISGRPGRKLVWAQFTIEDGVHFSSNGH